jgi:DMSO/TMAO reductase YedYZ molybdopterin-dependent catalytic subunit
MNRPPIVPNANRTGWRAALSLGIPATVVAMGLMFWARQTYQIRTLPERIMDWALQFIPLDLFEQGLEQFGTSAKEIALIGTYVGMAVVLVVLAALALRRGPGAIAGLTIGIWLLAMAVIMPVTGAGFFATGLPQDVLLTNVSFLALAFAYGTVLLLVYSLFLAGPATAARGTTTTSDARRAFLGGVVGTAAAYAATFVLGQSAGSSSSSLPLANVSTLTQPTPEPPTPAPAATNVAVASVPTPAAAPPTIAGAATPTAAANPTVAASPQPTQAAASAAVPTPVATAAPAPTAPTAPTPAPTAGSSIVIPPRPPPAQAVTRDQNGSLTASTRAAGQLQPEYTPGASFYITTKNAGGDPVVDPAKWRLVLDGELNKPVQLDLPILYQLPSVQVVKTLECISNWVNMCEQVPFGCGLIGNAAWKGARLSDVLALAGGLKPGVVGIITLAVDEFTSFIPADPTLLHDTLLVYEMNGQVLPLEHGYPARLLVPGRYGMKSPKWVVGIRPTKSEYADWYGRLGWNKQGIVQAMTRIDVPALGATLPAGPQPIAGIAYAGARGVSKVEFSADGGQSWRTAGFLEDPPGKDVWVRWQGTFTMPASGSITLAARCVDGSGTPQNTKYTITQPDGGTGLFTTVVKAG